MTVISDDAMERARALFGDSGPAASHGPVNDSGPRLNVGAYLDHHGKPCTVKTTTAGTLYVLADGCLFDQGHKDAGILQTAGGVLLYKCFHDSCQEHTWAEARKIISGDGKLAPFMGGEQKRGGDEQPNRPIDPLVCLKTGAELQTMEVRVEWLVPDVLPAGSLTTLTGRAGIGKTTLLLCMADAMSKGGSFLGRQTGKTPVYYVDFENPLPVVVETARKLNITNVCFLAARL